MTTLDLLAATWKWDPLAITVSLLAPLAYGLTTRSRWCARALYVTAAVLFALALASPVGTLADGYLFSAHMLQHLLLVLIVPPLALLGLAPSREPRPARSRRIPTIVSWAMGVGAMWLWHAPTLCNAAAQSALVHRIQEASLLVMGTAYWWPILAPRASQRIEPLSGIVYLFSACVACTVLGVVVTFSPVEVCSVYLHPVDRLGILPTLRGSWGMTPEKDQQLGGLLMWIPACLVYVGAILSMLARFYRGETRARTDVV